MPAIKELSLTPDTVKDILQGNGAPCISLFMQTEQKGPGVQQNSIRFKNLLTQAKRKIEDAGHKRALGDQVEAARKSMLEDWNFWQHQRQGLAVFLREQGAAYVRCEHPLENRVEISSEPVITPLVHEIQQSTDFFLVVVSRKACRVIRGNQATAEQVDLPDLPESLEAISPAEQGRGFDLHSFRTDRPAGSGGETATPHGHERPDDDEMIRRYLRMIDDQVEDVVPGKETPVVFCGVKELFAMYRDVTQLKSLYGESVEGNFDRSTVGELHHIAWPVVSRAISQRLQHDLDRLDRADGQHVLHEFNEIVRAAELRAIDTLFVTRLGPSDPGNESEQQQFDHLIRETVRNSGTIRVVDNPVNGKSCTALLRFPLPRE